MGTEGIWLTKPDYEMLDFLVELYEKRQDKDFHDKAFIWSKLGVTRRRVNRREINYSYVIRIAIGELYRIEKGQEEEIKRNAKHMYVGEKRFGFGKKKQDVLG